MHIRRYAALFFAIHRLTLPKFVENEGLDLVSKIPSSEGPSRQTRRAYTEKLKLFNASTAPLPTTSSVSARQRKVPIDCPIPTVAISTPVPRTNGKGKGRATQAGTDNYLPPQTDLGPKHDTIISSITVTRKSSRMETTKQPETQSSPKVCIGDFGLDRCSLSFSENRLGETYLLPPALSKLKRVLTNRHCRPSSESSSSFVAQNPSIPTLRSYLWHPNSTHRLPSFWNLTFNPLARKRTKEPLQKKLWKRRGYGRRSTSFERQEGLSLGRSIPSERS